MTEQINKETLAYVVGVAIGDGNLSNPNGRAVRLRITCDLRYPNLIERVCSSIKELLPQNKISVWKRAENYGDISCYSNRWEDWLNWNVGKGSKIEQRVSIPRWIKENHKFSIACLRGLVETDGSIYLDRGYKMVNFVSAMPELARDVEKMINNLGFKAHLYKTRTKTFPKYTVRLSRDTGEFIKLVNLIKN